MGVSVTSVSRADNRSSHRHHRRHSGQIAPQWGIFRKRHELIGFLFVFLPCLLDFHFYCHTKKSESSDMTRY